MQLPFPASNNPLLIKIDLSHKEKAEADLQGVPQVLEETESQAHSPGIRTSRTLVD